MKVKNIMFAGFAAAILMGTCGAARADDNKILTSKAYVDTQNAAQNQVIDTKVAQSEYNTKVAALQQGIDSKVAQTEYDAKVAELAQDIENMNGEGGTVAVQIASALTEAKGYTDTELSAHATTAGQTYATKTELSNQNTTLTDAIATAKGEAIDAAAADATSKANQALTDAKAYTDTEIGELGESENVVAYVAASQTAQNTTLRAEIATAKGEAISAAAADATTKADAAKTAAEATAASALATAKAELEGKIETAQSEATYDDTAVRGLIQANTDKFADYTTTTAQQAIDAAQNTAIADAEKNAKDYADGLAVNYDSVGSAAQALVDAKAYADQAEADAVATAKGYTDAQVEAAQADTTAVASDLADLRTDLSQYSVVDGSGNTVALQSAYVAPAVIE